METILKAIPRELLGKKVKVLRAKGQIPAVVYGRNFQALPLILDKKEFIKIAEEAGEATLIKLEIDKKEPLNILIRKVQKDPVSDEIIHADLYKVDMSQKIQTEIPIEFVGVAPAVEELEGNLITNKDAIKVECLPDKLIPKIEVDVSILKTFDDLIHVKDLKIPVEINILEEPEDIVVQVTPPRSDEELEEMEQEAAVDTEKAGIEGIEAAAEKEKAEKEAAVATEEGTEKIAEAPATPKEKITKK